jgi:hypothetical protein
MLEMLYKIPSRVLDLRLTLTLSTIIENHQHSFMAGKGTQEFSLFTIHLIQDRQCTYCPLQLVSLDIEKTFDFICHAVIAQSLHVFGIPEILI